MTISVDQRTNLTLERWTPFLSTSEEKIQDHFRDDQRNTEDPGKPLHIWINKRELPSNHVEPEGSLVPFAT